MRGQVLADRNGITTARELGKHLGIPTRMTFIRRNIDYVVRYGNAKELSHEPGVVINSRQAIGQASNKVVARKIIESAGVSCPPTYTRIDRLYDATLPLVARPYHHTQGRNFNMVDNIQLARMFILKGYYIQELIQDIIHEYRIFVWRGNAFECNIKKPFRDEHSSLVKNHSNGWRFYNMISSSPNQIILDHSIMAVESLGLDFGAVDIAKRTNNKPCVFEVNSAPSLIGRKVGVLADYILDYVSGEK